jgi:hypothetical protein
MAQILLPLFPEETRMLTSNLGVKEIEGTVYYYLSGMPIYSHGVEQRDRFRYCTSNLLVQGLCRNVDIVRVFHVSTDSVRRNKKLLIEKGESAFFTGTKRVRRGHKLTATVLVSIQKKLDENRSVNSIAKGLNISEGSIRYAIKQGRLKKNH